MNSWHDGTCRGMRRPYGIPTFIPLPRFHCSRHATPFLSPSLVLFPPCSLEGSHTECLFYPFIVSLSHHSFTVTFSCPRSPPFFILMEIKSDTILITHTHHTPSLSNLSSLNLVSIFRCPSPPINPVYVRRVCVDSSVLAFCLSSHRHP